jgi:ribosomal protein L13E
MLTGIWPIVNGFIGLFSRHWRVRRVLTAAEVSPAGVFGAQNKQIGMMGKHRLMFGLPSAGDLLPCR